MITFHNSDELVILRSEKQKDTGRRSISYSEMSETQRVRNLLRAYNAYLAEQLIVLFDGWTYFPDMIQTKRSFTDGSWSEGGRLFGGEFQRISKNVAPKQKINGEVTVELDIKSCHPTMAFAQAALIGTAQKLTISMIYRVSIGIERIKKAFNIMLNAKSRDTAKGLQ